jgi:phosphate transport system substrate-binding protein
VNPIRTLAVVAMSGALALGATACGDDDDTSTTGASGTDNAEKLSGTIKLDGSSTVFPFAQAAAELFNEEQPDVRITVGQSGTGGGFEKFCAAETDISNASRPIKDDEEAPLCEKAGVAFSEVHVANDGLAVVTNPDLKVDCLTVDQLKKVWNKGSKITSLKQVDPALPDTKLSLYGAGTDSGTFDYFTAEINGEEGVTRDDYQASEDDNQLVTGVEGDAGGLGYFGFSYYEGAADKLNLVGIDGGDGCVKPSKETVQDGTYKPLARPLFMYPSTKAIARPEVKAFLEFTIANQEKIADAAKFVPLTAEQATAASEALTKAETA